MEKEIDLDNGFRVKINEQNQTASVIASKQVTGKVFIPRYVKDNGKKYIISSIGVKAFENAKFDLLAFPEDSEIELFDESAFYKANFTKLQIPPKLKKINNSCFKLIKNLVDIEVSPKNELFSYIENQYLVGKSKEDSDVFDVLYYTRYDIQDAVIPIQIEIIKEYSFFYYTKLKSITFPKNSKLKQIERCAFNKSTLSKLVLPESLEEIKYQAFYSTEYLNKIV